jgi:pyruvate dehydrogenase E2 component (dihydrolipoamide acetyltransferase)
MADPVKVLVPDIGGFKDVDVIDVLVKSGQQIEKETPLITLETEKAAMDVPAPAAGKIAEIKVKKGDKVSEGSLILLLESGEGSKGEAEPKTAAEPKAAGKAKAAPEETKASAARPAASGETKGHAESAEGNGASSEDQSAVSAKKQASKDIGAAGEGEAASAARAAQAKASGEPSGAVSRVDEKAFSTAYASPSVRKFARELGADLGKIKGTGPKNRITHDDVKGYVKAIVTAPGAGQAAGAPAGSGLPKVPDVDFSQFGEIEVKPLSRIQIISGARLQASWVNLPHVTQHEDADITDMDIARVALKGKAEQEGVRLTPLAFIIRAAIVALKKFPRFNASLDATGRQLVFKKYFHIGFAADTPNGLLVPVIRDADRLNLFDLARALAAMSEKARAGKLSAAEMQGGSFTVSSLGGIGGTAFTPIINAPEVAILGVSKSSHKPVFDRGSFVPRLMLPLSLSYDHRVIDGAEAARFVVFLSQTLGDVKALV